MDENEKKASLARLQMMSSFAGDTMTSAASSNEALEHSLSEGDLGSYLVEVHLEEVVPAPPHASAQGGALDATAAPLAATADLSLASALLGAGAGATSAAPQPLQLPQQPPHPLPPHPKVEQRVRHTLLHVEDPKAFQRVSFGIAPDAMYDDVHSCDRLWRALELRKLHAYKKPVYYMGACATTPHFVGWLKEQQALRSRREGKSPAHTPLIPHPPPVHETTNILRAYLATPQDRHCMQCDQPLPPPAPAATASNPASPAHAGRPGPSSPTKATSTTLCSHHSSHSSHGQAPSSPTARVALSHSESKAQLESEVRRLREAHRSPDFVPPGEDGGVRDLVVPMLPPSGHTYDGATGIFLVSPPVGGQGQGAEPAPLRIGKPAAGGGEAAAAPETPHVGLSGIIPDAPKLFPSTAAALRSVAAAAAAAEGALAGGGASSSSDSLPPLPGPPHLSLAGLQQQAAEDPSASFTLQPWEVFVKSYNELLAIVTLPICRTFCYGRLQLLAQRFKLHTTMNGKKEKDHGAMVPKRDFYNTRKVDTHIHHSAAMNQKMLLRFMQGKIREDEERLKAAAARASPSPAAAAAAAASSSSSSSLGGGAFGLAEDGQESGGGATGGGGSGSGCSSRAGSSPQLPAPDSRPPRTVRVTADGTQQTLCDVLASMRISSHDLSINTLDMHADMSTMFRFDRFNLKYNPVNAAELRDVFLKTDNSMEGEYLAEITRQLHGQMVEEKYQYAENRLSVYGKKANEWSKLAKWAVQRVGYTSHIRWMIQTPRLYSTYWTGEGGAMPSFQALLANYFQPLFDVTIDPSCDPDLHTFLGWVSGVDLVDDESKAEEALALGVDTPRPSDWRSRAEPPYAYWCYYFSTNLASLNKLRGERGLTQFSFRPHCGEAGDPNHLVAGFLTAEHINHGLSLRKVPALEYLYYLAQIGVAMSPMSNNLLFCEYEDNPFPSYFARGLNVSLSTDDPLMFHHTNNPLLEEYAVAAQVFRLSATDMSELARNSVLQSGFEYPFKAHWVHNEYAKAGCGGNDITKTNLPLIRLQYRLETLREELCYLQAARARRALYPEVTAKAEAPVHPMARDNFTHVVSSKPSAVRLGGLGGGRQ